MPVRCNSSVLPSLNSLCKRARTGVSSTGAGAEERQPVVSAVETAEGIDVETYNAIGRAAQEDETLRAQLVAMVQQRVGMDPGTQNDEG